MVESGRVSHLIVGPDGAESVAQCLRPCCLCPLCFDYCLDDLLLRDVQLAVACSHVLVLVFVIAFVNGLKAL